MFPFTPTHRAVWVTQTENCFSLPFKLFKHANYLLSSLHPFLVLSSTFFHFCSIIKQFASHKDDKRRIEKALDVSGFPSGKGELLQQNKFQFEDFYNLYKNLTQRTEVEKIFEEL